MNRKNLLFICEGKDDEDLLNTIFDNHILEADISIYKYNTNIHLFAKHLFRNYSIGNGEVPIDDIDIIQVLKEFRYDPNLDKKYTYILFVFDYDPQDPRFDEKTLTKLIDILSDSTDVGQLFINYPMVEAALDFTALPDPQYNDKVCNLKDLKFNVYKNSVKKKSAIQHFNNISREDLRIVLKQTLEKMIYLTNGRSNDYCYLLDVQNELLRKYGKISIISTCLLFVRDYNADSFFRYIND